MSDEEKRADMLASLTTAEACLQDARSIARDIDADVVEGTCDELLCDMRSLLYAARRGGGSALSALREALPEEVEGE